jgi:adenine-specific DNA-methyltransferase
MAKKPPTLKSVETLKHDADKRKNIPTAEHQSVIQKEQEAPRTVKYPRNTDLDPQLVWRGKDEQDWSDLVVNAPPLYIQEKVHPKVLIDDLLAQTKAAKSQTPGFQIDLFADFNGMPKGVDKTEFYQHDQNWSNRMILGDSLQVMASLAEREGLRGKVQCIYFDPPYGIKFNSNFQWSTTSRDVKDGNAGHITREPEQVKAFRDTWRDGIHSCLTYLRDRLTVARDLLADTGSIFVQIGPENAHRVQALLEEVFGEDNFVSLISFSKSSSTNSPTGKTMVLPSTADFLLWFAKDASRTKFHQLYKPKEEGSSYDAVYTRGSEENPFTLSDLTAQKPTTVFDFVFEGKMFNPLPRGWRTTEDSMARVARADRIERVSGSIRYRQFLNDYPIIPRNNFWADTGTGSFTEPKVYVVQTGQKVIERCLLMCTDPGDLVLDPTCGSGTTAYMAEQWGRRWITIDTSRVALALARARIMGARYPFYLLADSREGQIKEAEVTRTAPSSQPVQGNKLRVKVNGVDVFDPSTGEVRSDSADGIACWFVDTDYNEESFFVRHAYFLGANDPYSALKTTLKAEINAEAWATLNSDTSRPFEKPKSGRIAVKVINHLGDEVMKVFKVT